MADFARLYIAGPVTGIPLAIPTFAAAESALQLAGYETFNPTLISDTGKSWPVAMRQCIAGLCGCDGVALLPVSWSSRGASWEIDIAYRLEIHVATVELWLQAARDRQTG